MKKLNIAYAAVALAMAFGQQAMAGDGTITFNGEVTDVTCDISANGSTANATVELPTVAASALSGPDQTAGATPFDISLSGCKGTLTEAKNVAVYFEPGTNVNGAGRLQNTITGTTGAKNVDIALYLPSNLDDPLELGVNPDKEYGTIAAGGSGTTTMNFVAKYYATAPAGAGLVNSSVTYSIIYP